MPTNGTHNWSPGLIFGAACTIFRAGAVPGAPGARRGPEGADNRPKTLGRTYHVILPKVCPDTGGSAVPVGVDFDGRAVRGVPLAILNTITIRSALGGPPRLIVVNFDGPISAHLGYHSSVVLVVLAVPCAVQIDGALCSTDRRPRCARVECGCFQC